MPINAWFDVLINEGRIYKSARRDDGNVTSAKKRSDNDADNLAGLIHAFPDFQI